MCIEFESSNSLQEYVFVNANSLIRVRFALNCRVDTCYCKSKLSEQLLWRNCVGIKKLLLTLLSCVNFPLVVHLLLLINDVIWIMNYNAMLLVTSYWHNRSLFLYKMTERDRGNHQINKAGLECIFLIVK
jgi:hypothetical protein